LATVDSLLRRFEGAFNSRQAQVLAEAIHDAYNVVVKTSDFNELKAIVKDLAEAHNRTATRLEELVVVQERTEAQIVALTVRMDNLTAAQEQTTSSINELTLTVRNLVQGLQNNNQELGGLSRNASYALENEAYRFLPALLQERYGIQLVERIIRAEIEGQEINFLARGQQNGHSVCLVGEAKLRLDERRDNYHEVENVLAQLDVKVAAVRKQYPDCEIIRLLVTHFARPAFLEQAQKQDVIVFEW
jgi:hypothetical protein